MEGEHAPTIIQLILSTDLAVIKLKDSQLILQISQQEALDIGFSGHCVISIGSVQELSIYQGQHNVGLNGPRLQRMVAQSAH